MTTVITECREDSLDEGDHHEEAVWVEAVLLLTHRVLLVGRQPVQAEPLQVLDTQDNWSRHIQVNRSSHIQGNWSSHIQGNWFSYTQGNWSSHTRGGWSSYTQGNWSRHI